MGDYARPELHCELGLRWHLAHGAWAHKVENDAVGNRDSGKIENDHFVADVGRLPTPPVLFQALEY